MDKVIYWLIAVVVCGAGWAQQLYTLNFFWSTALWVLVAASSVGMLSMSSKWVFLMDYTTKTWSEFNKVHWADLLESRGLALWVSLLIGIFSIIVWLMDRIAVWFLKYLV
jgi:preprotein translocase subunit SecE